MLDAVASTWLLSCSARYTCNRPYAMRTPWLTLIVGLPLLAFAGQAQQTEKPAQRSVAEVARAYFERYAAWDVEGLRTFYDQRSVWSDPTTAEIGPQVGPVTGPEAIVGLLRSSTRGIDDLRFEFEEQFSSGDRAIAIGRLKYTLRGKSIAPGARDVPFNLRVVAVLRIADGKVLEHTDFSDFRGWTEQVRAATK